MGGMFNSTIQTQIPEGPTLCLYVETTSESEVDSLSLATSGLEARVAEWVHLFHPQGVGEEFEASEISKASLQTVVLGEMRCEPREL